MFDEPFLFPFMFERMAVETSVEAPCAGGACKPVGFPRGDQAGLGSLRWGLPNARVCPPSLGTYISQKQKNHTRPKQNKLKNLPMSSWVTVFNLFGTRDWLAHLRAAHLRLCSPGPNRPLARTCPGPRAWGPLFLGANSWLLELRG